MNINFKKIAVIGSVILTILLVSSCTGAEEKKEMMDDKEMTTHSASMDMENKMEENIENKIEEIKEEMKDDMDVTESKYKDLAEFISTSLTEEQDKAILEILEQRTGRQAEIKVMLMKAVKEGNIEQKLEEVKIMRKVCAGRIMAFVSEDKKDAFTAHCDKGNEMLKEKFMNMDK